MKKTFLFLSGLLLLASCSNSDDLTNEAPALEEAQTVAPLSTEPIYGVPVKLSMGSVVNVTPSTKGTGTVGSIDGSAGNVWQYENLYVLMTTEGEGLVMEDGVVKVERLASMDKLVKDEDPTVPYNEPMLADRKAAGWGYVYVEPDQNQYDGTFISRPTDNAAQSGLVNFFSDFSQGQNPAVKYYPPQATCQFYGYHIDDAATALDANGNPMLTFDDANGLITTPFEIDGSQDLMTGMATEYMPVYNSDGSYKYPFFSAAVARHPDPTRAKQPTIQMEHKTVRFTFEARPGNVTSANEVKIESIEMESFTQGTLVAACRDITKKPYLDWEDEDWNNAKYIKLQGASTTPRTLAGPMGQGEVDIFNPETIKYDGSEGKVFPGALFVCPTARQNGNQKFYNMRVKVSEDINGVPQEQTLDIKVTMPNTEDYTGKSYNVVFYVYPHEVVVAQVELQGWENGATLHEFNLDPTLE